MYSVDKQQYKIWLPEQLDDATFCSSFKPSAKLTFYNEQNTTFLWCEWPNVGASKKWIYFSIIILPNQFNFSLQS